MLGESWFAKYFFLALCCSILFCSEVRDDLVRLGLKIIHSLVNLCY